MDASEILVAVMTAVAIVWLVWAERHSRRNTATQVEKAASQAETQAEQRRESKPRRRTQAA